MPVPLIFGALLKGLAAQGLSTLGNALLAKGKEAVEEKLGVKIPDKAEDLTPEVVARLREATMKHEEFLVDAQIRQAELDIKAEQGQEEERTKRWQMDMQSDSWLSKNIRPFTLMYWTVAITVLILIDSFSIDFKVEDKWIQLILYSYLTILGGYYTIRGAEKITKMITARKNGTGS